ncbi:MAG: helix-turn-helix transcriptional regulator [Chloroflexota bacterium]
MSEIMSPREYKRWFARVLKQARKSRRHTQADLAEFLEKRRPTISEWENGKGLPSLYEFYLIEELYGRAYFRPGVI